MASYKANLNKVLDSAAVKILARRGNQILTKAKAKVSDLAPLKKSLTYALTGSNHQNFVARVGSNAKDALEVELGARSYIIKAAPGGFLVFPGTHGHSGNKTGKWAGLVVVKQVTHPPVKARHYLKESVRETIGKAD